ncbi:MAG: Grx4 family monothiol glutaredoxin [Rhodoferax sp.]|nr:Grx4 family monothiol glutaredoxin [Rhodoferax sp.]
MSDTQERIDQLVKNNAVLLFMKGTASFPQCGFSGRAIQVLKACGVDPKSITTVNVLEDDAIRAGIKDYSHWPTIPQLYVKGEFIGGSDIMMEMYENGELQKALDSKIDSPAYARRIRPVGSPKFAWRRIRRQGTSACRASRCSAPVP